MRLGPNRSHSPCARLAQHKSMERRSCAGGAHLVDGGQGEARGALGAAELLADQHEHLEELQLLRLRAPREQLGLSGVPPA